MAITKTALLVALLALLAAPTVLGEGHTGAGDGHDDHDDHAQDHDHHHDDHDDDHMTDGGMHGGHGMNMTDAGELPPCAVDPGSPDCVSYEYPDNLALQGAKLNCQMMNFMVACDIVEACEDGELQPDNPHCDAFDLLASTCIDEGMMNMAGCNVYTPMCLNASSVVEQCDKHPGVPSMVNTMPTVAGIVAACDGSAAPGCADCASQDACPDTLESLNLLCASGAYPVCASREAMCVATGDNLSVFCEGVDSDAAGGTGTEAEVTASGAAGLAATAAAVAAAAALAALV